MKRIGLLSIVFGLLVPSFLLAQIPATISYQGRLDSAGVPIKSPKNLTFAIYAAAAGGTALWSEAQANVVFTNGMFSVNLGSVTPFPATLFTSAGERWLGVTLAGATEMTPRFQFTSSPFAMRAQNADGIADGAVTSAKIADGAVTSAKIAAAAIVTADLADNAVTAVKIADGAIAAAELADNSVTSAKIVDGAITSADLAANSVTGTQLAAGSVSAAKVSDEPGVAFLENGSFAALSTASASSQVAALTITTPASGYIVVNASGSIYFSVAGDNMVRVKVSATANDIVEAAGIQFIRLTTTGSAMQPFSVSRVFSATAGAHTYYLNIWHQLAPGTGYWEVFAMNAQYFPSRY